MIGRYTVSPAFPFTVPTSKLTPPVCPLGGVVVVVAVVAASVYAFIFTYIMLIVINWITPVKVDENAEKLGLDEALHGEKAYDDGVV